MHASELRANSTKIKAIIPAIIDTGIWINSLTRYPTSSTANTIHESLNNLESLITLLGSDRFSVSNVLGMDFLKYSHNTTILASKENRLGIIMRLTYSINPIWK